MEPNEPVLQQSTTHEWRFEPASHISISRDLAFIRKREAIREEPLPSNHRRTSLPDWAKSRRAGKLPDTVTTHATPDLVHGSCPLQRALGRPSDCISNPDVRAGQLTSTSVPRTLSVHRHDGLRVCPWLLARLERSCALWRVRLDRNTRQSIGAGWIPRQCVQRRSAVELRMAHLPQRYSVATGLCGFCNLAPQERIVSKPRCWAVS